MTDQLSANLRVKDIVTFGTFAGEPLDWRVLAVRDGRALLITRQVIDARPYDTRYTGTTWEGCSLRAWLNGEFAARAFTAEEQRRILRTAVPNPFNGPYGTSGGEPTQDFLFCLSLDEARHCFFSDDDRKAPPGPLARERGVSAYRDGAAWWLRSPGDDVCVAATIEANGYVNEGGWFMYTDSIGVRPAMWVALG